MLFCSPGKASFIFSPRYQRVLGVRGHPKGSGCWPADRQRDSRRDGRQRGGQLGDRGRLACVCTAAATLTRLKSGPLASDTRCGGSFHDICGPGSRPASGGHASPPRHRPLDPASRRLCCAISQSQPIHTSWKVMKKHPGESGVPDRAGAKCSFVLRNAP